MLIEIVNTCLLNTIFIQKREKGPRSPEGRQLGPELGLELGAGCWWCDWGLVLRLGAGAGAGSGAWAETRAGSGVEVGTWVGAGAGAKTRAGSGVEVGVGIGSKADGRPRRLLFTKNQETFAS